MSDSQLKHAQLVYRDTAVTCDSVLLLTYAFCLYNVYKGPNARFLYALLALLMTANACDILSIFFAGLWFDFNT